MDKREAASEVFGFIQKIKDDWRGMKERHARQKAHEKWVRETLDAKLAPYAEAFISKVLNDLKSIKPVTLSEEDRTDIIDAVQALDGALKKVLSNERLYADMARVIVETAKDSGYDETRDVQKITAALAQSMSETSYFNDGCAAYVEICDHENEFLGPKSCNAVANGLEKLFNSKLPGLNIDGATSDIGGFVTIYL